MEFQGEIVQMYTDYATGKNMMIFSSGSKFFEAAEPLLNKNLRITVKQWKEKRSLDANAYVWVLMSKIASVLGSNKDLIYEEMLRRRGVLALNEDGTPIVITLPAKVNIQTLGIHLKFFQSNCINEKEFKCYLVIKGSSEYDTKEMSDFIDEVVDECKELGIETMTPLELARMKAAWK